MNSVRVEKGCLKTVAAIGVLFLTGCASGYSLKSVEGGRVAMTDVYDSRPDREAVAVLQPYKHIVDSIMSPVIGHSAMAMAAYRPESPLSNLLADIIRQGAVRVMGKAADVGVMNMGGIRNSLPEGEITFGTVYEITPFENALCVVTLDGAALKKLFSQMASVGGEGLSGARLVITPQGGLVSAEVGGSLWMSTGLIRWPPLTILPRGMISWTLSVRRSLKCFLLCHCCSVPFLWIM